MSRILIVDDDPSQVRVLARAITVRDGDFEVATASSGSDAIQCLQSQAVDLVLTDLQMPDMNGFELLAWMLTHQPHVIVFTMTAYHDTDAETRLRELGDVECFVKPLDVSDVHGRLVQALRDGLQGQIRNIGLASLLQLIEIERQTCTLTVELDGRLGHLFIRGGHLVHAQYGDLIGEEAAIEVASWQTPSIAIASVCRVSERTIDRPMSFIVMEAMRKIDEDARGPVGSSDLDEELSFFGDFELDEQSPAPEASEPPPPRGSSRPPPRVAASQFPGRARSAAGAILVADASGTIVHRTGSFDRLEGLVQVVLAVWERKQASVAAVAPDDAVEEMVINSSTFCALARPMPGSDDRVLIGLFDPRRVNLAAERLALTEYLEAMGAWSSAQSG